MVVRDKPHEGPIEAHLWVCSGENIGRRFALDKLEHLIGRTANIDIPVIDERVSQRHARVALQEGRHYVEDLGSTNGTFVNNQPLNSPRRLQDGDLIQVGETVFEYISYEQRNLTITLRGTDKNNDAVPANLRTGAQEALNRARQVPSTGGTMHGTPPPPHAYHPGRGTVDMGEPGAIAPVQRPAQGMMQGAHMSPPYIATPFEDRRAVVVQEDDDEEEGGIDIQEVLRKVKMVIRFFLPYWKLVLALAIVFAVAGAYSTKLTPPKRTAVFEVNLVPGVSNNPVGDFTGNVAFFKSAEQNFRASNQIAHTLNEMGIEGVNSGFVSAVQGQLMFESVGPPQPNTYRGAFTNADGGFAVEFLEAHVKRFLESEIEKTLKIMKGQADFLAEQLAETENELRRTEAELLEFKQQNIDSLPAQAAAKYNLMFSKDQKKNELELELARIRAQQKLMEEQLQLEAPVVTTTEKFNNVYQGPISAKRRQLVEARASGKGPKHPDIVRLQKEIEELKNLAKQSKNEAAGTVSEINPAYRALQTSLRQLQLKEAVARRELAKVTKNIRNLRSDVKRLPELEARHSDLTRSYSAAQEKYKRIYEKLSTAKIQLQLERASAAARYDIISPPTLEFIDEKQKMTKRAMMGAAAGVFFGLLIAAVVQLRNHPVVTTALTLREPDAAPPVKLDD